MDPTPTSAGRLVLVATPIGNLGDLSPRAVEALRGADVVAAEDTRRSRVLLDHAGASVPMTSYHEHNETTKTDPLLDRVARGEVVAVVTDAGTPGLADPGFRLVRRAVERGLPVEAIPGPAAALQALLLSGLPMDRFAFEGFLPRKSGARRRRLEQVRDDPRTLIFYVSPHRASDDLSAMGDVLGERQCAVARELTKLHEEVWHGTLGELAQRANSAAVRGEVTVVVAGAPQVEDDLDAGDLAELVAERVAAGVDRKAAIAEVAKEVGRPKRDVYQAVLDASP